MTYNEDVSGTIAYTGVYEKRVGKILRAEERNAMELHVVHNPEIHPVVAGTGGFEKRGGATKERENVAVFE